MKKVSILVPENAVLQSIADPQYLFATVNQFRVASGKEPLFEVQLVGAKKKTLLSNGLYAVHTSQLLKEEVQTDLVIIPALTGDLKTAISKNAQLVSWVTRQYQGGAEVASLCLGAFLLAATGLLRGKRCSTHWGFQAEFREMFPEVAVVTGSIITTENRLYSSGGALSYWNLLLHLVEKYADRETAILASKYFAIDLDRENQLAFALFQGQKDHNDDAIAKAQGYIEKNVEEKITVDELASLATLGRRSFERRFKEATHNSVLEYINRVKMEAAKRSFEGSRKNINEVMYEVGYTDAKAFRNIFKKATGLTPLQYRNKYNKLVTA
jgi:transcriptional regulator GlxA family with amidase domain